MYRLVKISDFEKKRFQPSGDNTSFYGARNRNACTMPWPPTHRFIMHTDNHKNG